MAESRVIVLAFQGRGRADGMLEQLREMETEGLITLEDAVIVTVSPSGTPHMKQTRSVTGKTALKGSTIGLVAGFILGGPILGLALGAGVGAIRGATKDIGLDDKFVKQVTEALQPDSSAIFMQVRAQDGEKAAARLQGWDAKVISTDLDPEQEKRLKEILEGGASST